MMTGIIRKRNFAGGGLTEAEVDAMRLHSQEWIQIAFRTAPIEPAKIIPAIESLYAVCGRAKPRVVIVPSPLVMAVASTFAASIRRYRREDRLATLASVAVHDATIAAVHNATIAATDHAVRDAAYDATIAAATHDATAAAVRDAAERAVRAAAERAARADTYSATYSATAIATAAAVRAATATAAYDATERAVRAAASVAVHDATIAATHDAAYDATAARDAAYDATAAAVRAATDHAVRAATIATATAVRAATERAVRDATIATATAVRDATYDATARTATGWAVPLAGVLSGGDLELSRMMVESVKTWSRLFQGGNLWSSWECYLSAVRDVLGVRLPVHEKYAPWEQAAIHGSCRAMHEEFCMVSDFPEVIRTDDDRQPHCEDGPSHRWRDGWSLWHIHGVVVDSQVVMSPETQTIQQLLSEGNEEVKRIRIERYGWERFLGDVQAEVVETSRNDIEGTDESLMRAGGMTLLVCACPSTARVYAMEVPNSIETCRHAQAWLRNSEDGFCIGAT